MVDDFTKLLCVLLLFYEDDDLVEIKGVEKRDELLDLLVLFKLDIVLLESMQGEFGVGVDVQLKRLFHVQLAHRLELI